MTTTNHTKATVKPTRGDAAQTVQEWAGQYLAAERGHEFLAEVDQYVRHLAVALHADVVTNDFCLVLAALEEVQQVEAEDHEDLPEHPSSVDITELMIVKRDDLTGYTNRLLDRAGFGVKAGSVAA